MDKRSIVSGIQREKESKLGLSPGTFSDVTPFKKRLKEIDNKTKKIFGLDKKTNRKTKAKKFILPSEEGFKEKESIIKEKTTDEIMEEIFGELRPIFSFKDTKSDIQKQIDEGKM